MSKVTKIRIKILSTAIEKKCPYYILRAPLQNQAEHSMNSPIFGLSRPDCREMKQNKITADKQYYDRDTREFFNNIFIKVDIGH